MSTQTLINQSGSTISFQFAIVRSSLSTGGMLLAQADTVAHAAGLLGTSLASSVLNGAKSTVVPIGTPTWMQFTGIPTVGNTAYLSESTPGQVRDTAPPVAGTNQIIPLGIIARVSGTLGFVIPGPGPLVSIINTNSVVSGVIGRVNTSSVLTTLTVSGVDESIQFVDSYRSFFHLDKTTAGRSFQDNVVISGHDTGSWWVRMDDPDPSWLSQATWFIDPINGNDQNTGIDSGHALRTRSEFYRRIKTGSLNVDMTVTILSTLNTNDIERIQFNGYSSVGANKNITFIGIPIVLFSGVISTVTNRNGSTGTHTSMAINGLPSTWTDGSGGISFLGKVISSTTDGINFKEAISVTDEGGKQAWLSAPLTRNNTETTFTVGDPVAIWDLPSLGVDEMVPIGISISYTNLKVNGGTFIAPAGAIVVMRNCIGDIRNYGVGAFNSANGYTGVNSAAAQSFQTINGRSTIIGGRHRIVAAGGTLRLNTCPTVQAIQLEGTTIYGLDQASGGSQPSCDLEFNYTGSTLDAIFFGGLGAASLTIPGFVYGSIPSAPSVVRFGAQGGEVFFAKIPTLTGTNANLVKFSAEGTTANLTDIAFKTLRDKFGNFILGPSGPTWNTNRGQGITQGATASGVLDSFPIWSDVLALVSGVSVSGISSSFVPNQIAFGAPSGGGLTQTSALQFDPINTRVGIGAVPLTTLDINVTQSGFTNLRVNNSSTSTSLTTAEISTTNSTRAIHMGTLGINSVPYNVGTPNITSSTNYIMAFGFNAKPLYIGGGDGLSFQTGVSTQLERMQILTNGDILISGVSKNLYWNAVNSRLGWNNTNASAPIDILLDATLNTGLRVLNTTTGANALAQIQTSNGINSTLLGTTGTSFTGGSINPNLNANMSYLLASTSGIISGVAGNPLYIGSYGDLTIQTGSPQGNRIQIRSNGEIDLLNLSAGGLVKAIVPSGQLVLATSGIDYAVPGVSIIAGSGLAGGGDLTQNRTINIGTADGTITVNADTIQVGVITTANISNNAVDNTKIRDSIATSVIGRSANSTGDPADIQATVSGQFLRRDATSLGFAPIGLTDLPGSVTSVSGVVLTAGAGLTGGGALTTNRTFDVVAADATIIVNPDSIQVGVIQNANIRSSAATSVIGRSANSIGQVADITALASGHFLRRDGSGVLGFGTIVLSDLPPGITGGGTGGGDVFSTRQVIAGAGLTGGGNLTADRTFNVVAGDGTIIVDADDIKVGIVGDINLDIDSINPNKLASGGGPILIGRDNISTGACKEISIVSPLHMEDGDSELTIRPNGLSVIGRSDSASNANAQNISATTSGQFLGFNGSTLAFRPLVSSDLSNSPTDALDFHLSFGIGDGTTPESILPNASFSTIPFWLLPTTKNADVPQTFGEAYAGSPIYTDVNITRPAAINEFPVIGTFTRGSLTLHCTAFGIVNGGPFSPVFNLTMSKNGKCDSSPLTIGKSSVGDNTTGFLSLGNFSITTGDVVGLRFTSNSESNSSYVKFTATMRFLP